MLIANGFHPVVAISPLHRDRPSSLQKLRLANAFRPSLILKAKKISLTRFSYVHLSCEVATTLQ